METKKFFKVEIPSSFRANSDWTWKTAIRDVIPFLDTVIFTIDRPDSGTATGGVAYIKDDNGNLITSVKIPGKNTPAKGEIQDDRLDFEDNSYLLEYGPDQVDQHVKAVAATVDIVQAIPGRYQPSTCTGLNNSSSHILSRYHIPQQILEEGNKVEMYAVEGDQLLDDHHAINGVIHTLSADDPYQGTVLLQYKEGTFKRGQTYTVCLNVYSWVRQIAGYKFIF
jgi:hypothetical protein